MTRRSSLKIVEQTIVAPPPDSPTDPAIPKSLPLTFFDLVFLRSPPTLGFYFYEASIASTTFCDSILPKLKLSLSLTLTLFSPLAGNLIWPENSDTPLINYVEGDGVSFTVALSDSDSDFHRLSGMDFVEARENRSLVPQLTASAGKAAAMALQVTLFPNQGFCIGLAMNHAVADGKIFTTFMKSWAQRFKLGDDQTSLSLSDEKPLYERSIIKDPKGLASIYARHWLDFGGTNNKSLVMNPEPQVPSDTVRGIFELSRAKIEKLREFVKLEVAKKNEEPFYVSTFSLAAAYSCTCLAKTEGISSKSELVLMSFPVDCRSRMEPPIPSYFGNCVTGKTAFANAKEIMGNGGFLVALKTIGEAIKSLDCDGITYGAENRLSGKHNFPPFKLYTFAGSLRFDVYSTDFGWGRPRKVDFPSLATTGAISLQDTRNGDGGVQIGLLLDKHLVETFASIFAKGLEE
ncbi:phenolic glucoside malonyltransferase 1-like [Ziziphus jujuba]|uniref:Phenolic glucoside malonyltransferase 1-like n=1 Tax=Ziziphus jujuba TaxID=326968 RepID=A0ABM3IFE6_ZIZJJ|nr:phenolic glucoside malonyltransferase 1-like [Ziziphus jujuba]